ncbi:MAG TPA: MarR family transcriptional regulator [Polyangia bacterium]|nr:MarR family transcriptional regulator [Polyangia bacterium]
MAIRKDLKEDLDRIVETIIYLVTESRRLSKDEAARYGVTPTQLSVIKLLHEIGDLSLGTLSREIRAHNSTVTGIVDRMEAAGMVERARSEEDRRVWIIRLTAQGRKVAERAKVSPWETLRHALASLPLADQERLTAILKKVALNVTSEATHGARR